MFFFSNFLVEDSCGLEMLLHFLGAPNFKLGALLDALSGDIKIAEFIQETETNLRFLKLSLSCTFC